MASYIQVQYILNKVNLRFLILIYMHMYYQLINLFPIHHLCIDGKFLVNSDIKIYLVVPLHNYSWLCMCILLYHCIL